MSNAKRASARTLADWRQLLYTQKLWAIELPE